jgi:tetratricopeptide (TPR) repeat protein
MPGARWWKCAPPSVRFQARIAAGRLRGPRIGRMLAIGTRSADPQVRVAALIIRANIYENKGVLHESMRDASRALPIAEAGADIYSVAMICQHLGSCYGQSARYSEAVAFYQRAVDGMRILRAVEEADQGLGFMAAALVGAGRTAQARRVIDTATAAEPQLHETAGAPTSAPPRLRRANVRLASLFIGAAEVFLAEGNIDEGLARFRRALMLSNWPLTGDEPGPFGVMVASAAICAHVVADRGAEIGPVVQELLDVVRVQFVRFPDLPQVGSAATAVACHGLAHGRDPRTCLTLFALAEKVSARQDMSAMQLSRRFESVAAILGPAAVAAERARAARLTRHHALADILAILEPM